MPRVGSSKMKISPLVLNHLASTTFCWFPPERFMTRTLASLWP